MANQLDMAEHQAIIGLARLKWSYRKIAAELGVDRQTVSRHIKAELADGSGAGPPLRPGSALPDPNATIAITGSSVSEVIGSAPQPLGVCDGSSDPNAAMVITGPTLLVPTGRESAGVRSQCEPWQEVILKGLEQGLTAQRIWQDLKSDHGFAGGYLSVQRFVGKLKAATEPPFRRMECQPAEEAQIDFGKGAPILTPDGKRKRPHLFRFVLSCSRKAYSEVVMRQTTESFIRCIENAFWYFGGVTRTLVVDNLKAAVIRADWYDPELNPKIQAFCQHYGTVVLPTRPRTPRHKGKIERGVGYAQDNALKGRTFDSLADQNRFLAEWEASVADTRIHGTTRQQVNKLFEQVEKPALLPLPPQRFPLFQEARRIVNRDGHVEVAKAYYSAPPEFVGRTIWARWDGQVVRLFDEKMNQIGIHAQREPGRFATDANHISPQKRGGIERGAAWWLRKIDSIGANAGQWARSILQERGIHGVRVLMGLASLTGHHPIRAVERACQVAHSHGAHRLRDLRALLKRLEPPMLQSEFEFVEEHPLIRPLADYGKLVAAAFDNTRVTTNPLPPQPQEVLLS
jgi:transposase